MDSSPNPLIRLLSEETAKEIEAGNFQSLIGLIVFFFVLLLGGAYFAGAETSLASVNRIRIMSRADNGSKRAKRVLYILDHSYHVGFTIYFLDVGRMIKKQNGGKL